MCRAEMNMQSVDSAADDQLQSGINTNICNKKNFIYFEMYVKARNYDL